jgi:hypothetical protein|eukprot:COSAG01_NODE_5122_length_4471_cov_2.591263_5_plen_73_part_00
MMCRSRYSNFYTLNAPDAPGHTLLLCNHAATSLVHVTGTLPQVAAGHAAQLVFLGGTSWMMMQASPITLGTS